MTAATWRAYDYDQCECGGPKRKIAKQCKSCSIRRGADSPRWKGGHGSGGYVRKYRPEHPDATKGGYINEHRLVMEQTLGRRLRPEENVHHINGVRNDNRPENLELWTTAQPAGQRVVDKVAWAKSLLAQYETPAADQQGRLPVAIDFDGTLAESLWTPENPTTEIGPPIRLNIAKAREVARRGYKIVIHTARSWDDEPMLRAWLLEHQVPFDAIQCGKLLAALYIDDRGRHADESSWLP